VKIKPKFIYIYFFEILIASNTGMNYIRSIDLRSEMLTAFQKLLCVVNIK